jgi:hypothetical protein
VTVLIRCRLCMAAEGLGPAAELQALRTLAGALRAVPAALRSQLPLLERFVTERLCGQRSSPAARLAASHCLSLLPSVTGAPLLTIVRPTSLTGIRGSPRERWQPWRQSQLQRAPAAPLDKGHE